MLFGELSEEWALRFRGSALIALLEAHLIEGELRPEKPRHSRVL